ncbi:hypothetical protein A33Q_1659 [Indibacter alkaliphilus LW1]|uniref:Uncharacterized protein n=1 Tax=Indibacter alkaliphilus (strain CCUG 57479 / KCTC 22604 / LW1) TaxID=1189612 RepID=S2DKU0_INDAL|nr:hypothetical protein A33Q_1659 [Indibacter alkaliphilus LW1]
MGLASENLPCAQRLVAFVKPELSSLTWFLGNTISMEFFEILTLGESPSKE